MSTFELKLLLPNFTAHIFMHFMDVFISFQENELMDF